MTEICKNCGNKVFEKKVDKKNVKQESGGNYSESRLEHDMKIMMKRMDQMQEMMMKIINVIPKIMLPSQQPHQQDVNDAIEINSTQTTPIKSPSPIKDEMLSFDESEHESDILLAESYIKADMGDDPFTIKRLPSVILEQPIDCESIGFLSIGTSSENSQDTSSDDMYQESLLAIKSIVDEEDMELLSNIDNVYQMENLHQTFPILHQEELDAMEEQMKSNSNYKEQLIKELKLVRISMGVNCDFADVLEKLLDRELLSYYNWYGNQGKKSLQRYKIFSQLLREITVPPTGKSFDDIMHRALTVSHRRKNNQVYRKKRKIEVQT